MKTIPISELQKVISSCLANCCSSLGFTTTSSTTFYNQREKVTRIFNIGFLTQKHAAYFNSNTASFTLNIGVFFHFESETISLPKEYQCHMRGQLLRNFFQKHPMDLKGFGWMHAERWRRDIWWVRKDGKNLEKVLKHASKVTRKKSLKWLDKYSQIDTAISFLRNKPDGWRGGPFFIGSIGSPHRLDLIGKLEEFKKTQNVSP